MIPFKNFFILRETASSLDAGAYNDGDDGLSGTLLRRAKPETPLTKQQTGMTEGDIGADPGMYSFFGLTNESANDLHNWSIKNQIPNNVSTEKLHSTCVWSKKSFDQYSPCEHQIILQPNTYSFNILGGALVLVYSHLDTQKQWDLAKSLGAEFEFPKYISHITLSYDPGEFDHSKLDLPNFQITLEKEYVQELDEDEYIKEAFRKICCESENSEDEDKTLIQKAKDAVKQFIKDGTPRGAVTAYTKLTTPGKPLEKFHPGKLTVHRGEDDKALHHDERLGISWSKRPHIADKYAGDDGKVFDMKVTEKTPALDFSKILKIANKDAEVFVVKK